jgi:hypothetical protein
MNGGKISGNTASLEGGGVKMVGTKPFFTMTGGEISGNTAWKGGGVFVYGTFRIVSGTVYGSEAAAGTKKNTATSSEVKGAALYLNDSSSGTKVAQRGTFSGTTWTSKGDLTTTENTIKVVNGE